jgi:hypothetical protein
MELSSLGQVIASRRIDKEGAEAGYVVRIGAPQKFPDGRDFYCPVQIAPADREGGQILYSAGIDSIQALQLAMKLIGGLLLRLNRDSGGKLRWDGDENGDLGFPVPE